MPGCSFRSTSDLLKGAGALVFVKGARALALAFTAAFVISGCAGGNSSMPKPTAKNVELAGHHGQSTSLPTLKLGRNLYISRCGSCHSLKEPGFLTPADWPEMVARMAENSKIDAGQQRAITQYLVSVSAAVHDTAATQSRPGQTQPQPPAN